MYGAFVVENFTEYRFILFVVTILSNEINKTCTGVAIREETAMTAAHCFFNEVGTIVEPDSVVLFWKVRDGLEGWKATRLETHPTYRLGTVANDIGLATASGRFPSVLTKLGGQLSSREPCDIFGYGSYDRGSLLPLYLQMMRVDPENRRICKGKHGSLICVTFRNREMPCSGDSGAPLICNGAVKGILSYGFVAREVCGIIKTSVTGYQILASHRFWLNDTAGVDVESASRTASYHYLLIVTSLYLVFFNKKPNIQ